MADAEIERLGHLRHQPPADDVDDLLRKIDGRKVRLRDRTVTLRTGPSVAVRTIEMWWGERVLAAIAARG